MRLKFLNIPWGMATAETSVQHKAQEILAERTTLKAFRETFLAEESGNKIKDIRDAATNLKKTLDDLKIFPLAESQQDLHRNDIIRVMRPVVYVLERYEDNLALPYLSLWKSDLHKIENALPTLDTIERHFRGRADPKIKTIGDIPALQDPAASLDRVQRLQSFFEIFMPRYEAPPPAPSRQTSHAAGPSAP